MRIKNAVLSISTMSVIVALASSRSEAHHGPSVEPLYDTSALVELAGEVSDVFWRNPHVRFRVRVTEGDEAGEIWELEMNPINILARAGLNADLLQRGDAVKVAGVVSRRNPRLDYEMVSMDPLYLREPSVRGGHWEWLPGVELRPYECAVWEGSE